MAYNFFDALKSEINGYTKGPITEIKVYKNPKDRDRGIADMTRGGFEIQSINGKKGDFKAVKGVAMSVIGTFLFGPVGILAGALAGHKKDEWTIVFIKA